MKKGLKIIACLLILSSIILGVSDQYLVEQNLTNLAQRTLDAVYGEGNFIVRVQVKMSKAKYSVKYTQESNPKKSKNKKQNQEVYILPGVPALKNISPGSLNQLPFDSVTTMVEPKIKQLGVFVLVNKGYPRSKAKKAEKTLTEVLKLKQGRDRIKMEFKPFYENPNKQSKNITIVPGKEKILTAQNIFYILILLLMGVFVIIYSRTQKQLIENASIEAEGGGGSTSVNVNPSLELPEGLEGGGGDMKIDINSNIKTFFDFVTEGNINDLIYLVKSQKLSPEHISLIASFIPANLAAKLIQSLDTKVQSKIAISLSDQKLGGRQLLEKLEKKFKTDIECFVGGERKVSKLALLLSSTERKAIVTDAKKSNPAGYKKIRPHMVIFDDILLLDEAELQLVLSDVNLETLAVALINVDQKVFDTMMENLTKGAKDMVNQYLELKSETTNQIEKEKAQDDIIKVIKKMDTSGKINLSEKLKKA